jgi:hypothetical protein
MASAPRSERRRRGGGLTFTRFIWRPPRPVEEVDTTKPVLVSEVPRWV